MNSMFSFLSAFSLPTLSNFTTYIPGLSLPDNLQKRLVSFVLRRTLGRFVQHDGLLSERVDAQVSSGKLKIQRLDLDHAVSRLFCDANWRKTCIEIAIL
jgi:autophagy-related protein 2